MQHGIDIQKQGVGEEIRLGTPAERATVAHPPLRPLRHHLDDEANDVDGNEPFAHFSAVAEGSQKTGAFTAVVFAVVNTHDQFPGPKSRRRSFTILTIEGRCGERPWRGKNSAMAPRQRREVLVNLPCGRGWSLRKPRFSCMPGLPKTPAPATRRGIEADFGDILFSYNL